MSPTEREPDEATRRAEALGIDAAPDGQDAPPFFSLDFGNRGVVLGIGWTGEWAAEFARDRDGVLRVRAGMDRTRPKPHGGEEVRTPRILLLFWEGDSLCGRDLRGHRLGHRRHPCERGMRADGTGRGGRADTEFRLGAAAVSGV